MAVIGSWNGFQFIVSPTLIRGFTGLTIKGGTETEDKVSEKQKYVERLNSAVTEVSLTVSLNAYLGCDVRGEAESMVGTAMEGAKGYFYAGGKKLVPYQLMLISAEVTEIEIAPNGTWISCKIGLTMKQCEKWEALSAGTTGSGGTSGGGKETVKAQSFWGTATEDAVSAAANLAAQTAAAIGSQTALSLSTKPSTPTRTTKPSASGSDVSTVQSYTAQKAAEAIAYQKNAAAAAQKMVNDVYVNGRDQIRMQAD